jgi:2-polyprenyl-3-methyl-5-hydroxy-6-metoxy-1,4-benzoquinol methylase
LIARLVDVGCGTGRLVADLLDHGANVTGIDTSESAIARARHHSRTPSSG